VITQDHVGKRIIGLVENGNMDVMFKDAAYMLLILIAVEKQFNIEITDLEACDINTFEDLIKLIQEKENDITK